jgi:hypothetical protein
VLGVLAAGRALHVDRTFDLVENLDSVPRPAPKQLALHLRSIEMLENAREMARQ